MLEVRLLGRPDFVLNGERMPGLETYHIQSLLGALLLAPDRSLTRAALIEHLWPASESASGLANLRQLIHRIKLVWPACRHFLALERHRIAWRKDVLLWLDVDALQSILARPPALESLSQLSPLLRGPLMEGFEHRWLTSRRRELDRAVVAFLRRAVSWAESDEALDLTIRCLELYLRYTPGEGEAWGELARATDRRNAQRGGAEREALQARSAHPVSGQDSVRRVRHALLPAPPAQPGPGLPTAMHSRLVGRDAELAMLKGVWNQVLQTGTATLTVRGPTGIGKSFLVQHFREAVAQNDGHAVMVGCSESAALTPYSTLTGLLEGLPLDGLSHALRLEISRLIPELRERSTGQPPPPITTPSQLNTFLASLGQAFSFRSDHLLVIDDVQWCDQETLNFLTWLLQEGRPAHLLLILILNPMAAGLAAPSVALRLEELARHAPTTTLEIKPLDRGATYALARMNGADELPGERLDALYRASEGNPLFLLSLLSEDGLIDRAPRGSEEGFRDRIRRHLPRLPVRAQEVAAAASVLGREFLWSELAHCLESELEVVSGLEVLTSAGFVRERDAGRYEFVHGQICQAIYEGLSEARRQFLHRRAAATLLEKEDWTLASSMTLVSHLEKSGQPLVCARIAMMAVQRCRTLGTLETAVGLCTRAIELLAENRLARERWDALEARLELHISLSRHEAALTDLRVLESLLPEMDDPIHRRLTLAHLRLGLANLRTDVPAILEACETLIALGEAHGHPESAAEAYLQYSITLTGCGEVDRAREALERAEVLARKLDNAQFLLHIRLLQASQLGQRLQLREARDACREMLPALGAVTDEGLRLRFLLIYARTLINLGEHLVAAEELERLQERLQRKQESIYENIVPYFLARAYLEAGQCERAFQVIRSTELDTSNPSDGRFRNGLAELEIWLELGQVAEGRRLIDHYDAAGPLPGLLRLQLEHLRVSLLLEEGCLAEAEVLARQHLVLCEATDQLILTVHFKEHLGQTLLAQGRFEESERCAREGLALGSLSDNDEPWEGWRYGLRLLLVNAMMGQGRLKEAERELEAFLGMIERFPGRYRHPHLAWLVHARLAQARGNPAIARASLKRSLRLVEAGAQRFRDPALRAMWLGAPRQAAVLEAGRKEGLVVSAAVVLLSAGEVSRSGADLKER